jgi:flagellar biosynthetic protein FliR
MNLVLEDLLALLATGLIPMLRISAMLIAAPLVSLDAVSLPIRIVIGLALTWIIYPLIELPQINLMSAEGVTMIVRELFIGVSIAIVLQVVNAAIIVAGHAISTGMGLGMAQVMDPSAGTVPVGAQFDIATVILNVLTWSSMVFLGAMLIAMPVMLAMMLINLSLGIVTRSAPALNIFAIGFPAMIIAGFILVIINLPNIGYRIEWLWLEAFERVTSIWLVP